MKHIEQSLELESDPGAFWIVQELLGKVMDGFWVEGEGQDDKGETRRLPWVHTPS